MWPRKARLICNAEDRGGFDRAQNAEISVITGCHSTLTHLLGNVATDLLASNLDIFSIMSLRANRRLLIQNQLTCFRALVAGIQQVLAAATRHQRRVQRPSFINVTRVSRPDLNLLSNSTNHCNYE